jgi:hypothetical protein
VRHCDLSEEAVYIYTFHNEAHLVASDKWYAAGDSKLNRFLPHGGLMNARHVAS